MQTSTMTPSQNTKPRKAKKVKITNNRAHIEEVAHIVKVVPKTILRMITNQRNVSIPTDKRGVDMSVDLEALALNIDCDIDVLYRVMSGRDSFIKQVDAAEILGIPVRTFRYRNYPAAIRWGKVVRYSLKDLFHYESYGRVDGRRKDQ
jgi:hypothetical protein